MEDTYFREIKNLGRRNMIRYVNDNFVGRQAQHFLRLPVIIALLFNVPFYTPIASQSNSEAHRKCCLCVMLSCMPSNKCFTVSNTFHATGKI